MHRPARSRSVIADELIDTLAPQQLRQALRSAQQLVVRHEREVAFKQTTIDKLTHEMAVLKRLKFAARSEAYSLKRWPALVRFIDEGSFRSTTTGSRTRYGRSPSGATTGCSRAACVRASGLRR